MTQFETILSHYTIHGQNAEIIQRISKVFPEADLVRMRNDVAYFSNLASEVRVIGKSVPQL